MFCAALDAYCLLEVYSVLRARISAFNVPINLDQMSASMAIGAGQTKLEIKQQKFKTRLANKVCIL